MKEPPRAYSSFIDNVREDVAVEQPLLSTHGHEMIDTKFITTVKVISFTSGSILAVLSQILLYILLWDGSVLMSPTSAVLMFSLQWSFLTLLAVFVGISAQKYFLRRSDIRDDIIFQMEAYNIAGALSALAVTWLLNDTTARPHHFLHDNGLLTVGATLTIYGSFCAFVLRQSQSSAHVRRLRGGVDYTDSVDASLHETYQMIAALSGMLTGATNQLLVVPVLVELLHEADAESCISALSLLLFWCLTTFSVTTLGLWGTRRIVARDHIVDVSQHEKLMLSMDSYYMQASLIGMCVVLILWLILVENTGRMTALALLILVVLVWSTRKRVCTDHMPEQEFLEP
jgi:hypothetical protein